ncbi:hypothetical protein EV138_0579 [Kribbella voronezhensis]|uniref:Uncharacterized protein n=1 Tax=Kribbella voronezhensis TaxID=2512212 RepID=A0A4R7T5F0_9ACTN|nr:hypothetical protein [Kribbella voronezhensis]TDU87062.1 hypothetical protein EV138_0579 [Kribbella voronezhensis]
MGIWSSGDGEALARALGYYRLRAATEEPRSGVGELVEEGKQVRRMKARSLGRSVRGAHVVRAATEEP